MAFERVVRTFRSTPSGVVIDYRTLDGELLAYKYTWVKGYNRVIEMRALPPYLPMSSCQYCGAFDDRKHGAQMHINEQLGIPV